METRLFERMQQGDYEHLFFCQDYASGLKAVIAIHSTALGPAAGGTRMWNYATEEETITDALHLSRAMTYKLAAIGAPYGGGKCVVIGDPHHEKSEALLRALGRCVDRLGGLFRTGVDVGMTSKDMLIMSQETPYIVKEATGSRLGDSGTATALGVIEGMRACLQAVYGSPDLSSRSVLVQGVGSVGRQVVHQLVEAGAEVWVSELSQDVLSQIQQSYEVRSVPVDAVAHWQGDIYCPCALGGVLNAETIPQLQCRIVCGSANNQLAEPEHGELLSRRDILYAPDFLVNAGGALTHLGAMHPDGFDEAGVAAGIVQIGKSIQEVIALAQARGISPSRAAELLAEQRLAAVKRSFGRKNQ